MSIISFILILVIILFFLRKYFKGAQCKIKHSMKGKVVIITGASAGLGKESALDLIKLELKSFWHAEMKKKQNKQ